MEKKNLKSGIFSRYSGVFAILFSIAVIFLYVFKAESYMVSASLLFAFVFNLFVFIKHFELIKDFSRKRSSRLGFDSLLMIFLVAGILVLLNLLSIRHNVTLDLTVTGKYTHSPQTVTILENLKAPVEVIVFYPSYLSPLIRLSKDLLNSYSLMQPLITYNFVDPDKKPDLARQNNVSGYEAVVVKSGEKQVVIKGKLTEKLLTEAIINTTRKKTKYVYFTVGHGERDISDKQLHLGRIVENMRGEGLEVSSLNILQHGIFKNTSMIVIAAPDIPFSEEENKMLLEYFDTGGRIIFMIDPATNHGLDMVFEKLGVNFRDDIIFDPESRVADSGFTTPVVSTYIEHDITMDFRYTTAYPGVRSVLKSREHGRDIYFRGLAMTSDTSWARIDKNNYDLKFNPDVDKKGPFTIAAIVTPKSPVLGKPQPRAVLIGDSDFIAGPNAESFGNSLFFGNMVDWLLDSEVIAIRPKDRHLVSLIFEAKQKKLLFYPLVIIVPLLIMIRGVLVWNKRRRL